MSDRDRDLASVAASIRLAILDMVEAAGSGHIDSSYSCVEILLSLYGCVMNHSSDAPCAPDRDRLVLSKGHAAPALYAVLAEYGYFPKAELHTLRQLNSRLQGHPKRGLPGIEVGTGSLGQGLSIAAGMALGLMRRREGSLPRVFAILSDGELNEGQVWESLMFAGHYQIGNLTAVVDGNGLQYSGTTCEVSDLAGFGPAVTALGWSYMEVDGHSIRDISEAVRAHTISRPSLIFARTTKGHGGLFLENDLFWHGKVPGPDEIELLRAHLSRHLEKLSGA